MSATPKPAAVVRPAELAAAKMGDAVRVLGRLVSFDAKEDMAVFEDPCPKAQMDRFKVDVEYVVPHEALQEGTLVSVIGEIDSNDGQSGARDPIIKARILVPAEGLDVNLYASALDVRRKFLQDHGLYTPAPAPKRAREDRNNLRAEKRHQSSGAQPARDSGDNADMDNRGVVVLD